MRRVLTLCLLAICLAATALAAPAQSMPAQGMPTRAAGTPSGPPCVDWPVTLGQSSVNVLAPDTNANYWLLHYTNIPGARLRIHGTYPAARFFSFAVQDESAITLGSLRDDHIGADRGSLNPFRTTKARPGTGTYTTFIDFGAAPKHPAANTFYAGRTLEGLPNPGGTLVYRVYVPTDLSDPRGGVPLPTLSLDLPGGESVPLSLQQACSALPGPVSGPVNAPQDMVSYPDSAPRTKPNGKRYEDPAFARLFSGQFTDPVVAAAPDGVQQAAPHRKGIPLANADFPYLDSYITRYVGDVVVVRFKAPTFPDTVHGASVVGRHQTRYWSVCSYGPPAPHSEMHAFGCATDYRAAPDRHGWIYVVLSDRDHRPAAATLHQPGVHWVNWGGSNQDGYVLARFGVPDPHWVHSPLKVPMKAKDAAAASARVMGPYYPRAIYCSAATITAHGVRACYR